MPELGFDNLLPLTPKCLLASEGPIGNVLLDIEESGHSFDAMAYRQ